jgi:hypothetical protein
MKTLYLILAVVMLGSYIFTGNIASYVAGVYFFLYIKLQEILEKIEESKNEK